MATTPALIKELRELTGSGMSDCKKALDEVGGDIKKAIEFLREKGLAAAAKKAGRIAAEGVVAVAIEGKKAVIVEVNCETDYVAINADFKAYVNEIAAQLLNSSANSVEEFLQEAWAGDASQTVQQVLQGKIATIGENLNIRRFTKFNQEKSGIISSYIHGGGKIGAMLEIESDSSADELKELGHNLCMQIAALFPKYLKREEIDQDFIENEKKILLAAAQLENKESDKPKPESVIEKMVEGRLTKQLKEICLLEQEYVKEPSKTVAKYIEETAASIGASINLVRFVCFERGEGIEKKQEDFAS